MGIDPNNHLISHYLHRKSLEFWPENSKTDGSLLSDAGSSCANDQQPIGSLPDLNSLPSIHP